MSTHTPPRRYESFITYIMRSSRQSRVGSHASPKVDFNQGGLGVIWRLGGRAKVMIPLYGRGLYDLNFSPVLKEGESKFSYQLAQMWVRGKRSGGA